LNEWIEDGPARFRAGPPEETGHEHNFQMPMAINGIPMIGTGSVKIPMAISDHPAALPSFPFLRSSLTT
jgi:hypothetical protein